MGILEVQNVNKSFGGLKALHNVNLDIEEGVWREAVDPTGNELLPLIMGHENAGWIEEVGPEVEAAYSAWKAKAHQTVDNAHTRYFIAHLHRLRDEDHAASPTEELG